MPASEMLTIPAGIRFLPDLARDAMIREVDLSPKPGLVDSLDNGAHRDMNRDLFHKSARAVSPFFDEMVERTPRSGPPSCVLPRIRPVGIEAEKAMLEATGGVNTHKGQIFSMGVTLSAAVRVFYSGSVVSSPGSHILQEAGRICRGVTAELMETGKSEGLSHGEQVYRALGTTGIRGEAEAGFPCVRLMALPRLKELLEKRIPIETASLDVLIRLYERTGDSTVLHRGGKGGLTLMKSSARNFLNSGGIEREDAMQELEAMNSLFISENISPGGCADLLALTLLVKSIEDLWRVRKDEGSRNHSPGHPECQRQTGAVQKEASQFEDGHSCSAGGEFTGGHKEQQQDKAHIQ